MSLSLHLSGRRRPALSAPRALAGSTRGRLEPRPALVTIGVIGAAQRLDSLEAALPDAWQLAAVPGSWLVGSAVEPALVVCDALLLDDADRRSVQLARTRLASTPIVALLAVDAPAGRVVEVLQAGADSCVQATDPTAVLFAHLRACLRRRSVSL